MNTNKLHSGNDSKSISCLTEVAKSGNLIVLCLDNNSFLTHGPLHKCTPRLTLS